MKKKFLVMVMTAMVGATVVTGCGAKSSDTDKETKQEATSTPTASQDDEANAGADVNGGDSESSDSGEDKGAIGGAISDYIEKEHMSTDSQTEDMIKSCINAALAMEESYLEFQNAKARELVFTDAASVEAEAKKIGESFANELSVLLVDLKAPVSKGAKEYVVTWNIEDNGDITKLRCDVRFEDGTLLSDKDKEDSEVSVDEEDAEIDENTDEDSGLIGGSILDYLDSSKMAKDEMMVATIKSCFNAATCTEEVYEEVMNASVKEVAFTDAASIETACEEVGENFALEMSASLTDLQAPSSKGTKEYVLTWEVSEDGVLGKVRCKVRLNDGTFLTDSDGEEVTA